MYSLPKGLPAGVTKISMHDAKRIFDDFLNRENPFIIDGIACSYAELLKVLDPVQYESDFMDYYSLLKTYRWWYFE